MKEKYKTDLTKCIETEIYPSIELKLMQKVKLSVDKQFGTIKSTFVPLREFEFQTEDIRNNVRENMEKQDEINDSFYTKFDLTFGRFDTFVDEYPTNVRFESELEKYTRLTRFIRVEDQLDDFMTKSTNENQ